MSFMLRPKYRALRQVAKRSHNRRVMVLFAVMIPFLVIGVVFAARVPSWFNGCVMILEVVACIFGIILVNRFDKQQSVRLGYICPLCGAGLFSAGEGRLWVLGQCQHCKQSITEILVEDS